MLQAGSVLMALIFLYYGIHGLRGVPDKHGNVTTKPVAISLIVLAVALMVGAFIILPFFLRDVLAATNFLSNT